MIDDVFVRFKDAVREPVGAHELPDVFLRIETLVPAAAAASARCRRSLFDLAPCQRLALVHSAKADEGPTGDIDPVAAVQSVPPVAASMAA
jgi:hypothetical protein